MFCQFTNWGASFEHEQFCTTSLTSWNVLKSHKTVHGRLSYLFLATLWSPAGKGLIVGTLVYLVFFCFCHSSIYGLIYIRTKGDVGIVKHAQALQLFFTDRSKAVLHRRCFICGSFLLFMIDVCLCYAVLSVPWSLVITCWETTGLLALVCLMFSCALPLSHGMPGQVWFLIV